MVTKKLTFSFLSAEQEVGGSVAKKAITRFTFIIWEDNYYTRYSNLEQDK